MKKIFAPTLIDLDTIILISNNKYVDNNNGNFINYNFKLDEINREASYYILYIILRETLFKLNALETKSNYISNEGLIFNDIYIDLPSKKLEGIDRNYNKIMLFLCNKHLNSENILFKKKYSSNQSYSYCLNYKYINEQFKIIEIKKRSIIKRLNEECIVRLKDKIIKRDLNYLYEDFTEKIIVKLDNLDSKVSNNNIINEYISLVNLFDFYNGKKWMSFNKNTDGRLHHNITNMRSIHRILLRNHNDEDFAEIDISSCIPYLLIMCFLKLDENYEINNLNDDLINYRKLFKIALESLEGESKEKFISEASKILISIIENRFYELVIGDSNLNKKDILSYFFCKNKSKPLIENHIKNFFPNFYYLVYKMKENQFWISNFGYQPLVDCNKMLAHFLFHLEAHIMLYKVVPTIKKKFKKITVITIHDCIMVPKKYEKEVVYKLKEIFKSIFYLSPSLKVK
ncbi:hypothetical protein ACTS9T_03565 [Empedobacter falsenii]